MFSSGHLALPYTIGKKVPGGKRVGNWIEVNVETASAETQSFFDEGLTEEMMKAAKGILSQRQLFTTNRTFAAEWNESLVLSRSPLRTRGMCLRADLDGFTKLVHEAFDHGASAVTTLVQQFTQILEFPIQFAHELGRPIIELPWAGDCCTLLVRPAFQESLEEMRSVLPAEAGRKWHWLAGQTNKQSNWPEVLKGSRWAVGFACGDKKEGGDGNAVITEFPASNRSFRVIVGWSSRRAKDAQEADGVKAGFVVVPETDYQNLENVLKPNFSPLGSLYRSTTYEKLSTSRENTKIELAKSAETRIAGVSAVVPTQRPSCHSLETHFTKSRLLTLASAIEKRLVTKTQFLINKTCCSLEFSGRLNLSHDDVLTEKQAQCSFVIYENYPLLKPDVYCRDSWVRKEWDWHVHSTGWVCFELPERWFDLITDVHRKEGETAATEVAAEWCLHSTRWLLYRHYIASIEGIRKWPDEWPQWKHGNAGVIEYQKGRK